MACERDVAGMICGKEGLLDLLSMTRRNEARVLSSFSSFSMRFNFARGSSLSICLNVSPIGASRLFINGIMFEARATPGGGLGGRRFKD
jgi:hypothetical protein